MPRRKGDIEVICGSMFSGKTEELLRRLRLARVAGQRTQLFKPVIDDRYSSDSVVTHDGTPSQGATNAADALDLLAEVEPGSQSRGCRRSPFLTTAWSPNHSTCASIGATGQARGGRRS